MKFIKTTLIATLLITSQAASAEPPVGAPLVHGHGVSKCQVYLDAVEQGDKLRVMMFQTWAQGYISSFNFGMAMAKLSAPQVKITDDQLSKEILMNCREFPEYRFISIVDNITEWHFQKALYGDNE